MATPTIVQYYAWGANTNRNGVTSTTYTLRLCNPIASGNCCVLILDMQHGNTISSIKDNASTQNVWPTAASVSADAGAGGTLTGMWVLQNANAGPSTGSTITVTLNVADDNFHPIYVEIANIATSAAVGTTGTSHTTTAPSPSVGTVTATAGSLLLGYCIDNSNLIGDGAQALTAISATSGWNILTGDICYASNPSMNYHALQYNTNATGSAQSTTMSLTSGTHAMNYVVLELKSASAGTLPPSTGIYVFGHKCALNGNITASPWKAFMPNTGSTLALIEDDGSLTAAPTDSVGNTWKLDVTGSSAPVSAAAHASGLQPSQSNILSFTVTGTPQNTNYMIFDIWNAGGVQQHVTFPVTSEGTSFTGTCSITPQRANGLVINFAGTGIGPILTQTQPSGAFYISPNYTNETDDDDMINANGLSIYYYGTSLSAQSYGYTIAVGTSINATAIEIQAWSFEDDSTGDGNYQPPAAPQVVQPQGYPVTVW